jgi:hypothetical protein
VTGIQVELRALAKKIEQQEKMKQEDMIKVMYTEITIKWL